MNRVRYKDLGRIRYEEAWKFQKEIFAEVLSEKKQRDGEHRSDNPTRQPGFQTLVFCEHPHVYTLGKNGKQNNLLINPEALERIGAEFFEIDRGGDITYHGPGQLVGYPIFDLESMGIGVREYIRLLEESIILCLRDFGLTASRLEGAAGVWLEPGGFPVARKICAIGVRVSRHVTMHGFALNVNTDLDYFQYINPCGFDDKGVTSLQRESGREIDMEQVKTRMKFRLSELFGMELTEYTG